MNTGKLAGLAGMIALTLGGNALADSNVALNAPVTVVATDPDPAAGFNNGTAGNLGKITDGVLLPEATGYNTATATQSAVEWNGAQFVFQINLGSEYTINSVLVQADDNDAYSLQYLDASTNTWTALYTAPIVSIGQGLVSRPLFTLPTSIETDAIRFFGGQSDDNGCFDGSCGQGGYAVSQIELFGTAAAVPEPGMAWLMLAGLIGTATVTARRRAVR